jgi:hypothetical protein
MTNPVLTLKKPNNNEISNSILDAGNECYPFGGRYICNGRSNQNHFYQRKIQDELNKKKSEQSGSGLKALITILLAGIGSSFLLREGLKIQFLNLR